MTDNNLERLKSDIKLNTPARLYVFHGEEAYLRRYYLESLHKLLVEDFAEAFNYHRFNAENISPQGVLDSIEALPMMARRSMVQIDDVNFFALGEDGPAYAKFFSDIPDYCTVVLVYETVEFKPDKRKTALAQAFEGATVVEFTQPSDRELISWVSRHFKQQGKRISADDAQYLIHRTGGTMTALGGEIEKICAYSGADEIRKSDIDAVTEPVLDAVVFQMTDLIGEGKYGQALLKLQELFKMQQEPLAILGAVGGSLRRIGMARTLMEAGKGSGELQKLCGIPDYPARKTMEAARRFSGTFCAKAAELVLEADYAMKTSFDDSERILELLVLELAREARNG